jgi:predicted nucleotidyltransferase component of viral defense system
MLTAKNLESFTKKFQTDSRNVIREYGQHLFLSHLYQVKGSERLLFKGGTALRIVYHSPRFSEDLDFTGVQITQKEVESLFAETLSVLEQTGVPVKLNTATDTTGGYIGNATLDIYGHKIDIHIEVSLRKSKPIKGHQTLITSEFIPPYTLVHLPQEDLVQGKLDALLDRQKPRDFYDLYFLLRGGQFTAKQKNSLPQVLQLLKATKISFNSELKTFLPKSHQMIIKDFKQTLTREINKYVKN